jgi:hypothetical protein
VELSAKAGAVRQILLELLENPQDIRQMTIMGRVCNIRRGDGSIECSLPSEKKIAEDEEQEMEMLLECYLQRYLTAYPVDSSSTSIFPTTREVHMSLEVPHNWK